MYQILAFITKRPDMSTDDFINYYENHHIPLVIALSGDTLPPVYKRRYIRRGSPGTDIRTAAAGPQIDFDVVTELGFADEAAFDAWLGALRKDGGGEKIVEDEERFMDRNRTRLVVVEEFVTGG